MAADSDRLYRGFVQHRRTYNTLANGNGLPREADLLEGEIAINLGSRQLFTKRNKNTDESTSTTVSTGGVTNDVGVRIRFFGLARTLENEVNDSDFTILEKTKTVTLPNVINPTGIELANAFQSAFNDDAELTASIRTGFPDEVFIRHTNGMMPHNIDLSDLVGRIDFSSSPIHRIPSSGSTGLGENDLIAFYSTGSDVFATSSGVVSSVNGNNVYVTDLTVNPVNFSLNGQSIYKRTQTTQEIILLNNIPTARAEFPAGPSFGDLAILTDPDRKGLYWYDDSRTSDTAAQTEIRNIINGFSGDSDAINTFLKNRNLVLETGNSESDPAATFAEWRSLVSPERIVANQIQVIDGDLEYKDRIIFDRGATFSDSDNGNFSIDVIRPDAVFLAPIDQNGIGTNNPKFFVYDANGNVIDQFVTRNNLVAMNTDLGDDGFLRRDGSNTIIGTISPENDDAYDLGASAARFSNIYSETFTGTTFDGTTFTGTATQALYADLAENYLADEEYEIGTVIAVGGEAEVTAASYDTEHSVLGVVSEKPAYLMNSGLEGGTAVALKGRVPVKVQGVVRKGDRLAPSEERGVAKVDNRKNAWSFAIALEDSSVSVVEAVIL